MRIPVFSVIQIARRVAVVWAIEVVALLVLDRVLPGLALYGWQAAVIAVAVIGLLNALVRPLLLTFMMPVTIVTFGFITLVINAAILLLADLIVPGMELSGMGTALIAALGLAIINMVFARLFSIDDQDSFYRNLVRQLSRRAAPEDSGEHPGLILIEIDGLAKSYLDVAIQQGYVPEIARWLRRGTHKVSRWDCGLPSQTSSSQAGILHGNSFDIPGFRWYDKELGRVLVSNHPRDTAIIEARISDGKGLLHADGLSVCNMLSGDADMSIATMSTWSGRSVQRVSPVYFNFFVNPYNFIRALGRALWEIMVELVEGWRDQLRGIEPRVSRGGWFPFLRAVSTVVNRDISVHLVTAQMFAGVPIAYTTFVGYDVVAHHAGPARTDSFRILRNIDQRVRELRRAAEGAPRPYRFVILSDHGQSASVPFRQLYGETLESLVRTLLGEEGRVHAADAPHEGWGHFNALLSDAIRPERFASRAARRFLRRRTRDGYVDMAPPATEPPEDPDAVVCASGNLGLIYFSSLEGRVSFETIALCYPRLIEGLVEHEGVDFVLVHSYQRGGIVIGKRGVHFLDSDRIEGEDPLAHYDDNAAHHLRRLDSFPRGGDIVVNGRFDAGTGSVVTFEEQVSTHGGLGGLQTEAFILHPAGWPIDNTKLRSADQIYTLLRQWQDALSPEPAEDDAG